MDLDKYFQTIEQFADDWLKSGISTEEFLKDIISTERDLFDELLLFRKSIIGAKDLVDVKGYLTLGFFREYEGIDRATCN